MSYIEQEKERIIQELLDSNKIVPGQLIDYKYFLELYEPYKNLMREIDFAEILGIKYGNYNHIKNEGKRARILKHKIEQITEEEKEKIIEKLLKENKIIIGQLINYEYFLELYEEYKSKITEVDFAKMLGISYANYMNIKNKKTQSGRKVRTKILENKQEEISTKEKEKIIETLLNECKVKAGQAIDYTYFLELYEPYKNKMKEIDFAEALGITYSNYRHMKNREARARVLKDDKKQINESKKGKRKILKNTSKALDEEEKRTIIEGLLDETRIKVGQSIDYACLLELYDSYKANIEEIDFAEILGISYSNYMSLKNKGKKARVLKYKKKQLTEEEKEEILVKLLSDNKIKPGQSIDYTQFLELYKPYKDKIGKVDFAKILGINYGNYMCLKNKGTNAIIRDYREKEKIDRIKHILKQETRYYSKKEIEKLAEEYEIDEKRIIQHIFYLGKERDISDYITLLEEKGQIWIGKIKCSKKFANIHANSIIKYAEQISKRVCFKYQCQNIAKDVAGNAIIYILEQCGDIDKNFHDKEMIAKEWIEARMSLFATYKCLEKLSNKECSMEVRYANSKGERETFERVIKDETRNVEKEVLEKIQETTENKSIEEKCIQILMKNVGEGLNREEALSKTGEMLDINPEEMLELLKTYMIKQNRVRETQDGEYVLGE